METKEPYHTNRAVTDKQIVKHGIALLKDGLLISALATRLMIEYDITRAKATRLAQRVMREVR